ncbi:MAG: aldose epimerase family protein [Caulobacteraceae bacterium]
MTLHAFGRLADGRPVQAVRLSTPGGLALEILDYGAIVRRLAAPSRAGPVETVLGFDNVAAYEADKGYQGCIVGRCANRIGRARFEIDGEAFDVDANEGANCLHGGWLGFGKRLWRFEASSQTSATLTYVSPDGEAGFPGEVSARVVLTLVDPMALEIAYEAVASQPTPLNLTHHLYFNLSGDHGRSVLGHDLQVAAEAITPVEGDLIPTGAFMPVAGTPFDLRGPTRIRAALDGDHPQLRIGGGIDHNWVLEPGASPAVRLTSPETGLSLAVETDQPGMQVYSGQGLGAPFVRYGGLVLEPQGFPDAINQPAFPSVMLRPGQAYRRRVLYRFSGGG